MPQKKMQEGEGESKRGKIIFFKKEMESERENEKEKRVGDGQTGSEGEKEGE
jgi:hypothetical protein